WAFEFECATQQIRGATAAAVTDHSVKARRGIAGDILERNWSCPGLIAELVLVSLRNKEQVALLKSDRVALAVNAQPAGAPFDDVEMREGSSRKPDRPWRRQFAPTEDPALQLERVENVCEHVRPGGLQRLRHCDLPRTQEDRSFLWATWA